MMNTMNEPRSRSPLPWRLIGWGGAALLLSLPLLTGAPWTASDYVTAAVAFALVGGLVELAIRMSSDRYYRAGAAVAVVASLMLVWVNLAVGFLASEDNPANLMFAAVIAVAVGGACIAHFRSAGMVRAMIAAAMAQVTVGLIGLIGGYASPGGQGLYEVTMGTSLFAGLWLLSSWLFSRAR